MKVGFRWNLQALALPVAASLAAAECSFHVLQNWGCTHDPYKHTRNASGPDACCSICESDPECQAFTFHESDHSCLYSLGAGVMHGNTVKGVTCGTRGPLPPPGPAPGPGPSPPSNLPSKEFDCGMRKLALDFARSNFPSSASGALVDPDDVAASIHEALQLGPACDSELPDSTAPQLAPTADFAMSRSNTEHGGRQHAEEDESAATFYVDPVEGSDDNTGTAAAPWQTVERAAQELAHGARSNAGATVVALLPGTHRLKDTLDLGAAHSGKDASHPVVFRGGPGVVLSGARDLSALHWMEASPENLGSVAVAGLRIWSAPIIADFPFESLFAGDRRQLRARFPNGSPESYCARDLHGGQCPGYAQAGPTVVKGAGSSGKPVAAANAFVHSARSGKLLASGLLQPLDQVHNLSVPSPNDAWLDLKPSWSEFQAFEGGALAKYDATWTKPFWNVKVPDHMVYIAPGSAGGFTNLSWSRPEEAVLHTYQTGYWGSWSFQVAAVTPENKTITFSRGGFQESRGGTIGGKGSRGRAQDYYVENVREELDSGREFYYDTAVGRLYWAPENDAAPSAAARLEAPTLRTLVKVSGGRHVEFHSVGFRHSLPTFLEPHEQTSGGDWAIHRGGAVVVEESSSIAFRDCEFRALEGNGLVLSRTVLNTTITGCEFSDIGATPVLLAGVADLMDGRAGTQPVGNEVSRNHIHHFGIWNRQAAGYHQGLSRANLVKGNIIHDGPRAGANFNDGFGGGLVFESNLLFNVVQDTGEHGNTNSWDRQPMLYTDDGGVMQLVPAPLHIRRNLVFRNSFRGPTSNKWCLDKDDGSSQYWEYNNVLVYGAVKDRDGLSRNVSGNLILYPDKMPFADTTRTTIAMAFQVNGFAFDSFTNNTVVSEDGQIYQCTKGGFSTGQVPATADNVFMGSNGTFSATSCDSAKDLATWQALGNDKGSVMSDAPTPPADLVAMARQWLGMAEGVGSIRPASLVSEVHV